MKRLVHNFYTLADGISGKKNIFLFLPVVLVIISLLSAFPSYDIVHTSEFTPNWEVILKQTENPFIDHNYHAASHAANITFRMTPVVVGRALGISSVYGYLLLQFTVLILLFACTTRLFAKILGKGAVSLLLSSSIAFIFIGNVLCSDYRGFFDVLAFMLMFISILSQRPLIIFASSFLAFYTDERALIASSLIYVFFVIERDYSPDKKVIVKNFFDFNSKMAALLLSWIAYFASRFSLNYFMDLKTNSLGMVDYLFNHAIGHINAMPFAIWTGLEGFWLIVLCALTVLILNKRWSVLFFFCAAQIIVILIALWTFDITRSMAYLAPSIFISIYILHRSESAEVVKYIAIATFLLCLFPTYYSGGPNTISWLYPFPLQVIRILFLKS